MRSKKERKERFLRRKFKKAAQECVENICEVMENHDFRWTYYGITWSKLPYAIKQFGEHGKRYTKCNKCLKTFPVPQALEF